MEDKCLKCKFRKQYLKMISEHKGYILELYSIGTVKTVHLNSFRDSDAKAQATKIFKKNKRYHMCVLLRDDLSLVGNKYDRESNWV